MYRMLLVDDEPIIVDGLFETFKELENAELDIYKAYSAFEAISWMKRAKFDIVVSDIKMPGMSGLELLKEIRAHWPRCKVIFLTGYNDFEYAQTAIRYGGIDYLLKTEGDEETIKAVERAIEKLSQEIEAEEAIMKARQQINLMLPLLQKEYIWDLLHGDQYSQKALNVQFDKLRISLNAHMPVMLVLVNVNSWEGFSNPSDRNLFLFAIQNITEEYLQQAVTVFSLPYDRSRVLVFVQPLGNKDLCESQADEIWERTKNYLEGTLEDISSSCKSALNLCVSIAVSSHACSWAEIGAKFENLSILINRYKGNGKEALIISEQNVRGLPCEVNAGVEQKCRFQLKRVALLEEYLESGQEEEFRKLFAEIANIENTEQKDTATAKHQVYYSLIPVFLAYIHRWKLDLQGLDLFDIKRLTRYEEHLSWGDAMEFLVKLSELIFERQRSEQNYSDTKLVKKLQQYIHEHISEDLSLTQLSEVVSYSTFYLSRLYKQLTGESISDYISRARLDKAKEMLREGGMKISEVSKAIGFETPAYFTRFFKKMTNLTPQEFKDSFG